jgi:hypothetical protein
LQTTTLPVLFKRAPHFESQRSAIEQFFTESNLRFFGGAASTGAPDGIGSGSPAGAAQVSLRALATILRRTEKQHER